jgi:hypothetical protein
VQFIDDLVDGGQQDLHIAVRPWRLQHHTVGGEIVVRYIETDDVVLRLCETK